MRREEYTIKFNTKYDKIRSPIPIDSGYIGKSRKSGAFIREMVGPGVELYSGEDDRFGVSV